MSGAAQPRLGRGHRATLAVLTVASFSAAVAQTMVLPVVPEIQRQFGASTSSATFAVTAFLLTSAVATPIVGRLGDMFGKDRMLVATLALFAIGAFVAAAVDSIAAVIGARAIQGFGAGVFPLAFGIVRDELPPEQVGRGVGLINATFGVGTAVGVAGSGFVVDHLSLQAMFWLAFALTALSVPAARHWIPASPVRVPARIDWVGAALMAVGLGLILLGISRAGIEGWGASGTLALLLGGAGAMSVWVVHGLHARQPMVDMHLMAQRTVAATNATAFLVGFGLLSTYVLVPQLAQLPAESGFGFGVSASASGLFLLPSAVAMVIASSISGRLGDRHGARLPLLIGLTLATSTFALMLAFHADRTTVYGIMVVNGLGVGFSFAAMAQLIVEGVRPTETGVAAAVNTITRYTGGALGAQVAATTVAASALTSSAMPQESGFVAAFTISIVASVCALAVGAFGVPRGRGGCREAAREAEMSTVS